MSPCLVGSWYCLARLWHPQISCTHNALILHKLPHIRYRICGQNFSIFLPCSIKPQSWEMTITNFQNVLQPLFLLHLVLHSRTNPYRFFLLRYKSLLYLLNGMDLSCGANFRKISSGTRTLVVMSCTFDQIPITLDSTLQIGHPFFCTGGTHSHAHAGHICQFFLTLLDSWLQLPEYLCMRTFQ